MLHDDIRNCLLKKLSYPDDKNLQQRGIADKIESECNIILSSSFETQKAKSRRSIEDIVVNGCYVDHKTTDMALDFKMPNLISISRLKDIDKPLYYNFVKYDSNKKEIVDVMVLNVYELNWEHLKIQNLGKGQLQIKNMLAFYESPKTNLSKEEWLKRLQKEAVAFYDRLIIKTEKRKRLWLK